MRHWELIYGDSLPQSHTLILGGGPRQSNDRGYEGAGLHLPLAHARRDVSSEVLAIVVEQPVDRIRARILFTTFQCPVSGAQDSADVGKIGLSSVGCGWIARIYV